MSETELKEQVAALQKQVAALQAKIDPPKPSGVSVVSDHRRYDPTENISRLPRTPEEMPEWMREMVADPSSSDQVMADIRSDRAPRAQPSLAGASAGGDDRAQPVGSRHDKGR